MSGRTRRVLTALAVVAIPFAASVPGAAAKAQARVEPATTSSSFTVRGSHGYLVTLRAIRTGDKGSATVSVAAVRERGKAQLHRNPPHRLLTQR